VSLIVHNSLAFQRVCVFETCWPHLHAILHGNVAHLITGSTVLLTCCKGDCQSQWKTHLAHHSSETP